MRATRSPDFAAASAIAAPASTCADAGRSRAGVTTTSGTGGSCRPPMNHSGMSTPQSIGATAVAGSLPPKLTPTEGTPAETSDSSTSHARSVAAGTSREIEGGAPSSRPATRPATRTPIAFPMWTLWGVATTTASGRSATKSLPSSSMPARVDVASNRSSGLHASTIARPPRGATAGRDDAAVYRIAPDRALVATVDFFTPIVDDPAEFGAIAAANALSDVYAMGARPLFALGITAFPREKLGTGLLEKIVAGGAAKLTEAGISIVGGHSVDDAEPKFGYTVIGEVHPDRVIGNDGAQPGDILFLTKPLGSGLVATAIKRGLCPPALEREAVAVMSELNRAASEAMIAAGATAATDVTGYGLIGHLANIKGGADIQFAAIPFMAGVRKLAEADLFPSGSRRNHAAYRDEVEWT